jgi:hypothetical protein
MRCHLGVIVFKSEAEKPTTVVKAKGGVDGGLMGQ